VNSTDLSREIAAFFRQRSDLLSKYGAAWVVIVEDDCKGHFSEFDEAARFAIAHHRDQRFLIRHTTEPEPQIPMVVVEHVEA